MYPDWKERGKTVIYADDIILGQKILKALHNSY